MACRMLVAAGRFPWPSLLDGFKLMAQNENGNHEYRGRGHHVHGDGWGVMARSSGAVRFYKNAVACWQDPVFNELYSITPDLVMLHARRASPGTVVGHEFTHPFQDGDCYFCHNGTIYDFEGGARTDSQQFFDLILEHARQCGDMMEAISRTVRDVKDYSALNFILCSNDHVYVLNTYGRRGERTPHYYTMKYLSTEDYVVISSERLPGPRQGWREMRNASLLRLTLPDRQVEICNMPGPPRRP